MTKPPIKTFNTTGPCVPSEHYMLPVLQRQSEVDEMIEGKFYFILHAPRQSGKTTYLQTLCHNINSEGHMYALACSVSTLRTVADSEVAMTRLASQINISLKLSGVKELKDLAFSNNYLSQYDISIQIRLFLNYLAISLDKDLVVFFDEADCMEPSPLITFLAQIRDGYNDRHISSESKFPRSMALVGMRDIRDYLTHVRSDEMSRGLASPFNIKKEALTLANFTSAEIRTLYNQHTEASGQVFEDSVIDRAWYWTEGQPWLVNALAYEAVVKILKKDYSTTVTVDIMDQAAEILIKRRDTHIDSLLERLKEPRVIRVMDPVFAGTLSKVSPNSDDYQYCLDLGLVVEGENKRLRPANALYKEVMSRVVTDELQYAMSDNIAKTKWTDGQVVLLSELIKDFQKFWRHGSDSFPKRNADFTAVKYDEATYSFILMTFIQKVVNGGALVHREFAEGRGAVDICVVYREREYLIEVKLKGNEESREDSLRQLAGYLNSSGQREGWLVVFDRDRQKSWDKKIFWETIQFEGTTINVVGC